MRCEVVTSDALQSCKDNFGLSMILLGALFDITKVILWGALFGITKLIFWVIMLCTKLKEKNVKLLIKLFECFSMFVRSRYAHRKVHERTFIFCLTNPALCADKRMYVRRFA